MTTVDQLPPRLSDKIRFDYDAAERPVDGPCWIWQGPDNGKGYCQISYKGARQMVHRVVYTLLVGPIPDGLQIDHLCRVHPCCNPDHLEPVTNLENSLRSDRATRTHCIRNHPLSGGNLIVKKPGDRGRRQCRACYEMKVREATERKRQRRLAERDAKLERIRRIRHGLAVAS
jgi:hypothetical protein